MMEQSDQIALEPERVSVRQRVCCWTLLRGRLTWLTRLSVCVNQGSTLELRTTLTVERGAKAAADAGSNEMGMVTDVVGAWMKRLGLLGERASNERTNKQERKSGV